MQRWIRSVTWRKATLLRTKWSGRSPCARVLNSTHGDEMTSADVVASLEYAKSLPAATLYTASMSKIEAIDEYTVKITTSAPYAGLLYDLAYYYNYIVPKALIDANNDFSANPVGTGQLISSRNGIWVIISVSSATTIILTRRTRPRSPTSSSTLFPRGLPVRSP